MDHGLVAMTDFVSEIVSKETLGLFFIIIGFYAVVFQIKRLKMWFHAPNVMMSGSMKKSMKLYINYSLEKLSR